MGVHRTPQRQTQALTDFRRDPIDKLKLFRVDDERVRERREAALP